jgi:hypothetical protein
MLRKWRIKFQRGIRVDFCFRVPERDVFFRGVTPSNTPSKRASKRVWGFTRCSNEHAESIRWHSSPQSCLATNQKVRGSVSSGPGFAQEPSQTCRPLLSIKRKSERTKSVGVGVLRQHLKKEHCLSITEDTKCARCRSIIPMRKPRCYICIRSTGCGTLRSVLSLPVSLPKTGAIHALQGKQTTLSY